MPPRNNKKKGRGKGEKKTKVQKKIEKEGKCAKVQEMYRQLKADGCRIEFSEDGSTLILHPCLYKGADQRIWKDRSLIKMEDRELIVDNYIHNYEDDLRMGIYEGTKVICSNLACQYFGPILCKSLLEGKIQTDILCFLSKCNKKLCSVVKQNGSLAPEYQKLPFTWIDILTMMIEHVPNSDDIRLTFARSIEPLVTCMIDEKRELFKSREMWYLGMAPFFCLIHNIMLSDEGRSVMLSYNKLLPFIAQACCWRINRDDIVTDAMWLKLDASVSAACYDAQGVLYLVLDTSEFMGPLNLIASTPLLVKDPKCHVSIIAGFIQMMSNEKQIDTHFLKCIIDILIVNDKVDAQVIAELIKFGKRDDSSDQFVLKLMLVILGFDEEHDDIEKSDTRFAVAIQSGLLELVGKNGATEESILIAEALCTVSMHKKTSYALREKRSEISSVLLDNAQSSSTELVINIHDSLVFGTTYTCCNCLEEFDRSSVRFCSGCNVECYCSLSCQSESWKMGHDKACKDISNHIEELRDQNISETDIKRFEVLQNNVMMAGCRIIQLESDMLDGNDVLVDFRQYPTIIKPIIKDDIDQSDGCLKCTFISPVMYSSIVGNVVLHKCISSTRALKQVKVKVLSDTE